jgi:hypothetical protein
VQALRDWLGGSLVKVNVSPASSKGGSLPDI